MSNDVTAIALPLGRMLLGGLFVYGGIRHFFILDAVSGMLSARGLPAARLFLILGSIFELVAGALLMAGLFVKYAAVALIFFTVVASILMLNFWSLTGEARDMAKNAFFSNLAIIGGLLISAATAG